MKKAWLTLFALTVAGTIGTACTITTTDDDTDGGASSFGGSSNGGSSSGGASTKGGASALGGASAGGKTGTGGSGTGGSATGGSGPKVVCDVNENPTGKPAGSCEFAGADNTPCHECLAKDAECCAAIKECYGENPDNQCAWGGPDGESEYACIESCIRAKVIKTGTHTEADEDACVKTCTTPGCNGIGNATSVLVGCMLNNCEVECFSPE